MKRGGQISIDFMVGLFIVFAFVTASSVGLYHMYTQEKTHSTLVELQTITTTLAHHIDNIYAYGPNFQEKLLIDYGQMDSLTLILTPGKITVIGKAGGQTYSASAPITARVTSATISLSQGDALLLKTEIVGGVVSVSVEKL